MNDSALQMFFWGIVAGGLLLSVDIAAASWNVERVAGADVIHNTCHIESDPVRMSDGYQRVRTFIRVTDKQLDVVTESPLDAGFSDIGIVVDRNTLIAVEAVRDRKLARFETAHATLLQQFRRGTRVVVKLRFWPTWPATKIQQASFSLIGFTKAHDQMTACKRK